MYERLNEAITFAAACHAGQVRKLAGTPYILHPMEVASIIAAMTSDEDVMIAGLLHDTVEDCGLDPRVIAERFGSRVADLVGSETERRPAGCSDEETWMQRKQDSLRELELTTDRDVKILWLADKLSNIRSFYRSYRQMGNDVWSHLHQKDPKLQAWYYLTIGRLLADLSDTAAYEEYLRLVHEVFGEGEQ